MHAGRFDAADLHNAARELLLHRIVVAHLLHKLAGGHGGHVFEVLHARDLCAWQTFGSQQHTRFLVARCGH